MSSGIKNQKYDSRTVFTELVGILDSMTGDWESMNDTEIGRETHLIADLGFESIDVVQLVVAIEERFQSRSLPFANLLMVDGQYREDLRVGDIVDFLVENLGS